MGGVYYLCVVFGDNASEPIPKGDGQDLYTNIN